MAIPFGLAVLSNTLICALIACLLLVASPKWWKPRVLHLVWVLLLIKLFLPPIYGFGVLPREEVPVTLSSVSLFSPSESPGAELVLLPNRAEIWTVRLLVVWGLGSLLMAVWIGRKVGRFYRRLGLLTPADTALCQRVVGLALRLDCGRVPRVVTTTASISPLLWSFPGRSVLVLPISLLLRLTQDQQDTILAHELAHLKRRDDWLRWFELVAMVVFWWNPVAWVATHKLRETEEICCDQVVALALPDLVHDYANGLVETIRHLALIEPSRWVLASGLGRFGTIERRLEMLFEKKQGVGSGWIPGLLMLVLTGVLVGASPRFEAVVSEEPTVPTEIEFVGAPISFSLREGDLVLVLQTFAQLGDLEMEIDPEVQGTVTMELVDVPWDQALYQVLQINGLAYTVEEGVTRIRRGSLAPLVAPASVENDKPIVEAQFQGWSVYRVGSGGVTPPRFLGGPGLRYPELARSQGINGTVVVRCLVGPDGRVHDTAVVRSNADVLTASALEFVEGVEFSPAELEGQAVAVWWNLPVKFEL